MQSCLTRRIINKALPDSFILYKPRDVVSGDFPWFVQIKDEIFIAAVDCTGHGVPGALLSLIGYFLLNDIVRSRKITEPGKILDLLDEGVTTTLAKMKMPRRKMEWISHCVKSIIYSERWNMLEHTGHCTHEKWNDG